LSENHNFGQISINHNVDRPDANRLPYPANRLLGLLSSEDAAYRSVMRLKSLGIAEDQMEIFLGSAGAAALHSVHENDGLIGFLRGITGALGPETEHSAEYEKALDAGMVLIGVQASDESLIEKSREVLLSEGGQSLRYYGRLVIRDLN